MNIYLIMVFGGILGILLHAWVAILGIKKRNPGSTKKMIFNEYFTSEGWSLTGSVFTFLVLLFIASDFIDFSKIDKPDFSVDLKERLINFRLSQFIKSVSVIAGYFSDSIVYGFAGVTEKRIKKLLDDVEPKP